MFPCWERLVCLLLARSLSHPSPRAPHSEVLNLGIIPLHKDKEYFRNSKENGREFLKSLPNEIE